jgi:hypothetical protein
MTLDTTASHSHVRHGADPALAAALAAALAGACACADTPSVPRVEVARSPALSPPLSPPLSSDVRTKTTFRDVDPDRLLARLAAMPVHTWQYRTDRPSVRHMGPTAQDFHDAFALGDADTTIAMVDADGVALAGVKALERRTRAQAASLSALRAENQSLRAQVAALRGRSHDDAALRARVTALANAVARLEARRSVALAPRTPR